MARIKYPVDFLNRTELFKTIKKKHDDDGGSSPLIPFLNQQHIDLAADTTATNAAIEKHNQFEENAKTAEEATEARNNLFNPVFSRLRGSVQYLKGFYKGNEKELGLWGVQVNGGRMAYPSDFLRRAELFNNFKKRHDELGAASPLIPYLAEHNIDMEKDEGDVNKAAFNHGKAEQAANNAEDLREKRDLLFDPVFENIRSIGQFLKALYVKNPKELGHWGYTVDDSPRVYRKVVRKIAPQSDRTLVRLANGSVLTNGGQSELILHRGKEKGTEGISLQPGEDFEIRRGWGTLTVANSNHAETGLVYAEITS